jgi:hypothetical protein
MHGNRSHDPSSGAARWLPEADDSLSPGQHLRLAASSRPGALCPSRISLAPAHAPGPRNRLRLVSARSASCASADCHRIRRGKCSENRRLLGSEARLLGRPRPALSVLTLRLRPPPTPPKRGHSAGAGLPRRGSTMPAMLPRAFLASAITASAVLVASPFSRALADDSGQVLPGWRCVPSLGAVRQKFATRTRQYRTRPSTGAWLTTRSSAPFIERC